MTISSLFILDQKGKIIIHRDYRGDVKLSSVDRFVSHILEEDEVNVKPVFEDDGVSFIYIKHEDIYCMLSFYSYTKYSLKQYLPYQEEILMPLLPFYFCTS
jgi:hypothetical protein